jgi:hypothetical protein
MRNKGDQEKIADPIEKGNPNPSGQSRGNTHARESLIVVQEERERDTCPGKEEDQLSWDERRLLWLQIKLEELIPGYTDGVTQKKDSRTGGFPKRRIRNRGDRPPLKRRRGNKKSPFL